MLRGEQMIIQYIIRKVIYIMGAVYVTLDKFLEHETSPILGEEIDKDLQEMSRKELCNFIEETFGWEKDSFWELESTQKLRVSCQMYRNTKGD